MYSSYVLCVEVSTMYDVRTSYAQLVSKENSHETILYLCRVESCDRVALYWVVQI